MYPSKISYWLLVIFFLMFFSPIAFKVFYLKISKNMFWEVCSLTIFFGAILYLFLNTYYIIDNKNLKIRCGFITYKPIDINQIKVISKTNSIVASPAASFDRIEISYGKFNDIIISPSNKSQFINDLIAINPLSKFASTTKAALAILY